MIDTILFDLDGTLAPFIQDEFVKKYFYIYSEIVAKLGYSREGFIKAMWTGVDAMLKNDGSSLNMERFWDGFASVLGEDARKLKATANDFYKNEFNLVKSVVKPHAPRRHLIDSLKQKGFTLILATNPIFPPSAVASRLSWCGLSPDDFSYITTYDNSTFCKPNPGYYEEILKKCGKTVENCLMVGNNPDDDMAAAKLGFEVFLITDTIENPNDSDCSAYPNGSYADLEKYLLSLASPQ